jgi:hypothetical protein
LTLYVPLNQLITLDLKTPLLCRKYGGQHPGEGRAALICINFATLEML